jgi:hypothetical protein
MHYNAKIRGAIRDCLDTFPKGGTRREHLAEFTDRLSADPAWTRWEIHEVESTARRIFVRLKQGGEKNRRVVASRQ